MLAPVLQFALAWFSVAFAVGFADICWAKYSHAMGQGVAVKAGLWSAMIIITSTSAYSTVQYVNNHWLLSGALVGAFCGTYVGVKHSQKALAKTAAAIREPRHLRYRRSLRTASIAIPGNRTKVRFSRALGRHSQRFASGKGPRSTR